ncbi:FAD binding domain protein [Aspergillus alliaceus]|uniref:FAD binding domain protein n=1 Tax=Petromyces alliaceus TaxID=209559 RepID=A0A5N7BUF8_PETAA|nr:FAD binding domain protein [Aspergillus alliaceus]
MVALQITLDQVKHLTEQVHGHATVLSPDSEGYGRSLERWSDIGFQRPGVVISPKDAQGIAMTVRFAKDHYIDLAVKGGGHATHNASTSDGGILVDLRLMNRVHVDIGAKTVAVQGGALWADVSRETARYKLAVVGGTASQVGVGGLTLSGGYGYLTPQHGLALDSLISANVITGGGTELKVSAEQNPDLFWAIRGAGPNVGVVEEFIFRAYAQPNLVWYGKRSYPSSEVPRVVDALNRALVHPQGKAAAQCVLSLSPDDGATPIVTTILFFNGCEKEARRHFSQLLDFECVMEQLEMTPYSETNTILDPLVPPGGRKKILGFQMAPPVQPEFVSGLMENIHRKLTNESDLAKSALEIDFFDPTEVCRTSNAETAFPARHKLLNAALMLQWADPSNDEDFFSWGASIQSLCEDELRRQGYKPNHRVSNFIGYTQATARDMFGANADRLLSIKAKYDPANVFHKLNPLDRIL